MSEPNACTLVEDGDVPGQFRVEGLTEDGGCEVAIFSGPNALDRAIAFASAPAGYYDGWNDPQDWASQPSGTGEESLMATAQRMGMVPKWRRHVLPPKHPTFSFEEQGTKHGQLDP